MAAVLVLRVLGLVVVGAALVIGLAAGAIYFVSTTRLNQTVVIPAESVAIPTDITAIQRGQHLASAVAACAECHGPNLAGTVHVDDPLLARIVAPNLTRGRGGVGAALTNADFVRAIRHGVDPSGRQLLIMPSDDYNNFSDADLGAIIAYVRSLPAINTSWPPNDIRTVGLLLFALGQLPLQPAANIDHLAPRQVAPATGVTAEYGQYLANTAGCPTCHGPGLSGGPIPLAQANAAAAANLTPAGLGSWSEADFFKVMRTGIRPGGGAIGTSMPWPYFAQLTDSELRAIWRFLQGVPPRPTGTR
jgi:mono/diheme cytochrome c family protein